MLKGRFVLPFYLALYVCFRLMNADKADGSKSAWSWCGARGNGTADSEFDRRWVPPWSGQEAKLRRRGKVVPAVRDEEDRNAKDAASDSAIWPGRRNRLKGVRGRSTREKEKPPVFGMIERGGSIVIRMQENVKQKTIEPLIKAAIADGTLVNTDEYDLYARLEHWGYRHQSVCHGSDDDGDGLHEVHRPPPWKDSGHCCAPDLGPIGEFLKKSAPSISAFSRSCPTSENGERHSCLLSFSYHWARPRNT